MTHRSVWALSLTLPPQQHTRLQVYVLFSLPLSRKNKKGVEIEETLQELAEGITGEKTSRWTQSECILKTMRFCMDRYKNVLNDRVNLLDLPRIDPHPQPSMLEHVTTALGKRAEREARVKEERKFTD